jgi:hypothetical protein
MITEAAAPARPSDLPFFLNCITDMAVVLVSGFVLNLALGRSSFGAPLIVHLHAVAFMGWVAIIVTQAWLAAGGAARLHRMLGVLAVVWMCAMAVLGPLVTIAAVRTERVPFFFQPQHLLVADPATLLGAFMLFAGAVALRKNRDWHPRLQIGAFMMLMGPGVGRIIPMPFLTPYAFEIASTIPLIAPLIGMARDKRVHGRVHPAWLWSIGLLLALLIAARGIALSPAGDAIYAAATAGSQAAGSDGRAFPPPPPHP